MGVWSCRTHIQGHSKTQQDGLELTEKERAGPGRAGQGRAGRYEGGHSCKVTGLSTAGGGKTGHSKAIQSRPDQKTKAKLV